LLAEESIQERDLRRLASSRTLAFRLWVHNEVIFTTQVYTGIELNRPRWNVSQPQASGDGHEMNLHFDAGKMLPNTISGARGKRDHRQAMP
jgi:hypothetical protein